MRKCYLAFLIGIASVILPVSAPAQLVGNFSLSQKTYLAGQPVFLIATVRNEGSKPVQILNANPMSFCGGYDFKVTGASDRYRLPCGAKWPWGSCAATSMMLAPGKSHTTRILLNRRYDLRKPGVYQLHVTRRLGYGPPAESLGDFARNQTHKTLRAHLTILIQTSHSGELKPVFAQYARELESANLHKKVEAAQVIAYMAPESMQPTILRMLHMPLLQHYGVVGLCNLDTPTAHQVLKGFVKNSPPTSVVGPYQSAIICLGRIGDPNDVPLLLNVAHANAPQSLSRQLALESAGEAGGAAAIKALAAELKDPSIDTQQDAVQALYLTGARAAVPVLIRLLPSRNWRVSLTAEHGLEVLTHRRGVTIAGTQRMQPPPPGTYRKWSQWWKSHGKTATIYPSQPNQCVKFKPLPSRKDESHPTP